MNIFIAEKKQNESLHQTGRYILNYAAKEIYKISNAELIIINKKPKFKYSNVHFSISHSKDLAAVCFYENTLGFDIEKVLPVDYERISKRMNFTLKENTLIDFYKHWTLYEADYKLQQESFYTYTSDLEINGKKYIFSVASQKSFPEPEIFLI